MKTVRDVYMAAGKALGLTEDQMNGVFKRAEMRVPLNLNQEVPEEKFDLMVQVFSMMLSEFILASHSSKKARVEAVESSIRQRN